jgi:hypothetical protein
MSLRAWIMSLKTWMSSRNLSSSNTTIGCDGGSGCWMEVTLHEAAFFWNANDDKALIALLLINESHDQRSTLWVQAVPHA